MSRTTITISVLLAVALTLAGCPTGLLTDTPIRSATIADGAHGADSRLLFLPPMVNNPEQMDLTDLGEFDPDVPVVVLISDSAGATIAEYSTAPGYGSETVRVDASVTHYIVNWRVPSGPADMAPTRYQVSVLSSANGVILGYADVYAVGHGYERRDIDQTQYVDVKAGSTLPIKFWIGAGEANRPPEARNVAVAVDGDVGIGTYEFVDDDPEGASSYQWYRTIDPDAEPTPIPGATTPELGFLAIGDVAGGGSFYAFEVTPVDSLGLSGVPVLSSWVRPILFYDGPPFLAAFTNTDPDQVIVTRAIAVAGMTIHDYYAYDAVLPNSYNGPSVPAVSSRLVVHAVQDGLGDLYLVLVLGGSTDGPASIELEMSGYGLGEASFVVKDDPGEPAWQSWDTAIQSASFTVAPAGSETDGTAFGPIPRDNDSTIFLTVGASAVGVDAIEVYSSQFGHLYSVAWPVFSGSQVRLDFPARP